eukprot:TRINITY_DN26669_c0_g1_i3.p2 TRINITY_DN26669_c0_g1~~TRINITY_DN26669_c0_g1_i3.p2  ORF type:complete len:101 (+),score=16.79 TRINITY_DN26669_c0_g1_i3:237-539(+)
MELQGSHANTLRTMAQVPTVRAVPRPTSASLGSSMKPRRVGRATKETEACLLYTSDAADEEDSVDLGGRRIIKKKKTDNRTTHPNMQHPTQYQEYTLIEI